MPLLELHCMVCLHYLPCMAKAVPCRLVRNMLYGTSVQLTDLGFF